MASNLERVGVLLVAEGISGFLGAVTDAGKAVAGFLTDSIKQAGDFQQGLDVLQAVTGTSDAKMKDFSKTAIDLGNDIALPGTSAQDAAKAMTELAKAGLSVDDTLSAARGTLLLATAAETDAATAAGIVAGALNAFQLPGTEAAHVADILAAAANSSASSITDLSLGFQQAGFIFHTTKQPVDTLATALGILSNAGLGGSDAGTALKAAMMRLIKPTDKAAGLMKDLGLNVYDANGQMLPMRDIIGNVNKALAGMTDEQRNAALATIFLDDGMKAMIPLLDAGVAGFDAMNAKVNAAGAAQNLAGAQTQGFNGALAAVGNSLDTLKLVIGTQFLPLLTPLITLFATGIGTLTTFASALLGDKEAFDQLPPTLQSVITWLGNAQAAWGYWEKGIISTRTALDTLIPGLGDFAGPIIDKVLAGVGQITDAFGTGGLGAAVPKALEVMGNLRLAVVGAILNALPGIIDTLGQWATQFGAWVVKAGPPMLEQLGIQTGLLLDTIGAALPGIVAKLATWGAALVQWVIDKGPVLIQELANLGLKVVGWLVERLPGIAEQLGKWGVQFIEWVLPAAGKMIIALGELLGKFLVWFVNSQPSIKKQLVDWGIQFGLWIVNTAIPALLKGLAGLASTLFGWISDKAKEIGAKDSIGTAIVNAIKSGISKAWGALVGWFKGKLKELTDQLPFSEPKDHSSPLYGLGKTGEAIVAAIQGGISSAPQLIIPSPVLPDLNELVSGAAKDAKKAGAKKAPDLGLLIPDTKAIGRTLTEAVTNVALPEKTQKMLEQLRHKMALLDPSDIQAINALATMMEQVTAEGRQEALDMARARVSPPATAAQLAAGAGTVNNTRNQTINMPIHTNMTPTAISQSMAIIAASIP